ncbi:MAG TPA: hypothetical protein VNK43_04590, partial [Gemmatimonadales bacterium]|nr:hypothetical protein [Gemmatimonadales bacterium]
LLSVRGLPPVPGTLIVRGGVAEFHPAGDGAPLTYPLVERSRRPAVRLLRVEADAAGADSVYLFHLGRAVFTTRSPGPLRRSLERAELVDSLATTRPVDEAPLAERRDTAGMLRVVRAVSQGPYADSLYALFGRPARPVGLIGPGSRLAGRLGEYIASRDSVSLDPSGMRSMAQIRHALAHELAHRWQARDPGALRRLWKGVPGIGDSTRYGYRSQPEHQAEAVAFAIHYLGVTARPHDVPVPVDELLAGYDRLVPGTGVLVEYLLAQPLYRDHPLNRVEPDPAAGR